MKEDPNDWLLRRDLIPHIRAILEADLAAPNKPKEGTEIDTPYYYSVVSGMVHITVLLEPLEQ